MVRWQETTAYTHDKETISTERAGERKSRGRKRENRTEIFFKRFFYLFCTLSLSAYSLCALYLICAKYPSLVSKLIRKPQGRTTILTV
jgi:hypothetical protein